MLKTANVELGSLARDTVTGFVGTVTARAEYLYDTPSLRLTAATGQDDEKERWVSESRCELADDAKATGFGRV